MSSTPSDPMGWQLECNALQMAEEGLAAAKQRYEDVHRRVLQLRELNDQVESVSLAVTFLFKYIPASGRKKRSAREMRPAGSVYVL